jgi:hypothetical protein
MANIDISRVTARTVDGLRVALAGLRPDMRVLPIDETVDIGVATVDELRRLETLPFALDVFVPYRLLESTVVVIGRHDPLKDLE